MNYYQHPYISNSNLSQLKQEMMGNTDQQQYVDAYRIGALVE